MKPSNIGGQAVMEGIMMKNGSNYAVAVRKPNGEIEVQKQKCTESKLVSRCKKIPFLRGVFNFVDSLVLGMKTLSYSASFYEEEEEQKDLTEEEKKKAEKRDHLIMGITSVVSIVVAMVLFMVLPYAISNLFHSLVPSRILKTVIEALVRIGFFVVYILLISQMEDIKRVFMYHGAEHKCINCIEHGLTLNVENVRKSSKHHKRCGTSFLFFVLLVSIVVCFFITTESQILRVCIRIALLPVIAGISYECIRLAGRSEHWLVEWMSKPGMALQKLTTKEPTDDMIEVAICAVEEVFDWKTYLKENFEVETDDSERSL